MKQKVYAVLSLFVLLALVLTGCSKEDKNVEETTAPVGETTTVASFDADLKDFDALIASVPDDHAYAVVDLGKNNKALLVTDAAMEFDGDLEATEAIVYGYDKDGKLKEYGTIASTSTAYPFMLNDGYIYFGSHHYISRATVDPKQSKLVVKTAREVTNGTEKENKAFNEFFDAYSSGDLITFELSED